MVYNGDVPTAATTAVYTVPQPSPGISNSGNAQEVNLFRVVNDTANLRLINVWLNVNGTYRLISPKNTRLPPGSVWDDVPIIQLPIGGKIAIQADDVGVVWTINAYFVSVLR